MYKNIKFSRFTQTYTRNNIVAVFHALKMKPIYLEEDTYNLIEQLLKSDIEYDENYFHSSNLSKIVDALIDNRVLNTEEGKDDLVLQHFRGNLTRSEIKIAYFILSEACNLACSYCFENAPVCTLSQDSVMTSETAFKSIAFFEKMLALYDSSKEEKNIIFYGGEPLLNYEVLLQILLNISEKKKYNRLWDNVQLTIVTNGTLLTESIIKTLHSYGVSIAISIDGPKKITDINRFDQNGNSVYNEIIKSIELCKKLEVPFSLSMTLAEEAVMNDTDLFDFIEQVKPNSIGFNILMSDSSFKLPETYNKAASKLLIDAFKKFRLQNIYEDRMMRKVKAFVSSQVYPFDCGATGANQLVFSSSGKIGICHGYLEDKKYFPTHVDDTSFIPSENSTFMEWAKRSPLNMEQCQECIALGICGGGCPMNADKNHGSIWALDKRFCTHAKDTLEWLIWDLYDNSQPNN